MRSFVNSKLDLGTDPEMDKVKISGKTDMSDVNLIIHIIASVPEEYEVAVSDLEDRLTSVADKIDIEIVREKLSARFDRLKKNDMKDAVNETTLSALGVLLEDEDLHPDELAVFVKQFKGLCNKCGTYGHKAATCPNVKNDGGDLVLRRRMMKCQRHQRTLVKRSVSSVESMSTLNRTVNSTRSSRLGERKHQ
jgi:hypothetical protein